MATVVKVTTTDNDDVSVDAVEELLKLAHAGEDIIAFTDAGTIIYLDTSEDSPHDFLEIG